MGGGLVRAEVSQAAGVGEMLGRLWALLNCTCRCPLSAGPGCAGRRDPSPGSAPSGCSQWDLLRPGLMGRPLSTLWLYGDSGAGA